MFKGKNVLITGCNRGIGKTLVLKFLEKNANVICCVRKIDNQFKDFIDSIKKKKLKIIKVLEFDLEDEKKMTEQIKSLYSEKINIDILINNAATPQGSILEMTSISMVKKIFEINFFSQIKIIQLLLRIMKKSKNASIINIGSISGIKPARGNLSYGSSKAALMFASQILSEELKNYNIRVNAFAPSITETDMMKKIDQKAKEEMIKDTKLKRPYTTKEVAEKILFLASDKSKKVNGKIITMDNMYDWSK